MNPRRGLRARASEMAPHVRGCCAMRCQNSCVVANRLPAYVSAVETHQTPSVPLSPFTAMTSNPAVLTSMLRSPPAFRLKCGSSDSQAVGAFLQRVTVTELSANEARMTRER